jgi:hypothetical protein
MQKVLRAILTLDEAEAFVDENPCDLTVHTFSLSWFRREQILLTLALMTVASTERRQAHRLFAECAVSERR